MFCSTINFWLTCRNATSEIQIRNIEKVIDSTDDDGNQVNFLSNSNLNDFTVDNINKAAKQQTETKPNTVEPGEVKQQPRRMYKYVASNFRFRKKFDVDISDKIDNPKWFNILDIMMWKTRD